MADGVNLLRLPDSPDARGSSFGFSDGWLREGFVVRDLHVSSTEPGGLRGNHFHVVRKEILLVRFTDRWSAHWDTGPGTRVRTEQLSGSGCVVLQVPKFASHAIRNDGAAALHITALTDGPFDPSHPDSYSRPVAS